MYFGVDSLLFILIMTSLIPSLNSKRRTQLRLFEVAKTKLKLHGLSPRANYTDQATAACRRSDCQLLRIEGATWSA
jgi:hypothetical protein